MISIHHELRRQQLHARMILQVHDELVFDVPEGEVEQLEEIVKSKMENVYPLSVPLVVEIGTGKNWMET
jgi:DNA polymerase-1